MAKDDKPSKHLTEHFTTDEFACHCCGAIDMDAGFLQKLEGARAYAEMPFKILSGYRCQKRNALVGGVDESAHTRGMAADIGCATSRQRLAIVNALLLAGFTRLGIAVSFIHCDTDSEKPQNVIWLYSK